jgi:hypothetical protein
MVCGGDFQAADLALVEQCHRICGASDEGAHTSEQQQIADREIVHDCPPQERRKTITGGGNLWFHVA